MIFLRIFLTLSLLSFSLIGRDIIIQKASERSPFMQVVEPTEKPVNIAVISSSKVIGKYSASLYNVSLATLMSRRHGIAFQIKHYEMPDESIVSLDSVSKKLKEDGISAVLAPLTLAGAKNFVTLLTDIPVFIPTVHRRDVPNAPKNFTFGGLDYTAQIEALLPYMADSIAIFYDSSSVGTQLKSITEEIFLMRKGEKKKVSTYAVDTKGENIIAHLSKPAKFNKSSIILHIPVVKSAILAAHMTFVGIKERNILSTQINLDPAILTLTQYNDRKNMIIANSLIEFPVDIYETNILMNNEINIDWIQYATSVGIDYLVAELDNSERKYSMRVVNSQVIYPVELLQAKEYGFEPLR